MPFLLPLTAALSIAAHAVAGPVRLPLLPSPIAQDGAEEELALLAGLAERQLHDEVVRTAERFLRERSGHPKAAEARYRLGEAQYQLGRHAQVVESLAPLIAGRGGFEFEREVRLRMGQSFLELDDPARAAEVLEPFEGDVQDYLTRPCRALLAEARLDAGKFESATRVFEGLVAAAEQDAVTLDALCGLAWALSGAELPEESLAWSERFLTAAPDDSRVQEQRLLRAESLFALERFPLAFEAFVEVGGELTSTGASGAARAAERQQDHEAAAVQYRRALDNGPAGEQVAVLRLGLGRSLLAAGRAPAAVQALNAAEATLERDALLARALLQAGDANRALGLTEGRDLSGGDELQQPFLVDLQRSRIEALVALGRKEEASALSSQLTDVSDAERAVLLALEAGLYERTVELANALLQAAPDSESALNARLAQGEALYQLERFEEAAAAFGAAAAAQGEPGEALARTRMREAWSLWSVGSPERAAVSLETLLGEPGFRATLVADPVLAADAIYLRARCAEELGDVEGARTWLRRFEQSHGDGPEARGRRAEVLLRLARSLEGEAAERVYAELVAKCGEDELRFDARFERAESLSARGELEAALAAYEGLLDVGPAPELARETAFAAAYAEYGLERFGPAVERLIGLMTNRLSPERRADALELLVFSSANAGGLKVSAHAAEELIGLAPERAPGAVQCLTQALAVAEEHDTSLALWTALASSTPNPAVQLSARSERVFCLLDLARADEAAQAARALVQRVRLDNGAERIVVPEGAGEALLFTAAERFASAEPEAALELYELSIAADWAGVEDALYGAGFTAFQLENYQRCAAVLTQLLEQHPETTYAGEALFLLGEQHFVQGADGPAIAALAQLVANHERHSVWPKGLFRLGLAEERSGQDKAAVEHLTLLRRRAPEFPALAEADLARGRALSRQGDDRGAAQAFAAALEAGTGRTAAAARIGLGELDERAGRFEEALSAYLKVAVLYEACDEVAEALFATGRVLEAQDRIDSAIARYTEVIDDHPERPAAAKARGRLAELSR